MLTEDQIKKWADYLMWKAQEECEKSNGDARCNEIIASNDCPGYCCEGVVLLMVLQGKIILDELSMDKELAEMKLRAKKGR